MFRTSFLRPLLALSMIAMVGAGCAKLPSIGSSDEQKPSGPTPATFENVAPSEAANRINFVPGSVIEMRSTFLGFGAKLSAALAGDNKEGTRVIVIDRFAPLQTAALSWQYKTKVEAVSSIKAREDARKAGKTVPEPVMVDEAVTGKILGIDLRTSHSLLLPGYWQAKDDATGLGTSGIWLSDDVFQGLSRNQVSTLSFGVLDASLQGGVSTATDIKAALAKFQGEVEKIEDRVDVTKLEGDAQPIEWSLKVNGQDTKVQALKARTWFGEIIVLNNRQNPLILKATLNPTATGLGNIFNLSALQSLFGYEVTELKEVLM